jgi:excisionase family DNA binding protein
MNITEEEFARAVGISRVTVWRLRRAGKLAHYKVGTRVLYSPRHIEEFLASCEKRPRQIRQRRSEDTVPSNKACNVRSTITKERYDEE